MAEEVGEGARLRNNTSEVVVFVGGNHVAGFANVLRDVAVVVGSGEIELPVRGNGEQPAYAARVLERIGKIKSPEVLYLGHIGRAAVDCHNGFMNQIPVVVCECAVLDVVPFVCFDRGRWRRGSGDG